MKLHQSTAKTNEIQASKWFNYFKNLNGIHLKTDKDSHEAQIIKDYNRCAIPKNDMHLIGQLHLKRSLYNKKTTKEQKSYS